MKDVRRLAFSLLLDVEKKSSYSNLALKNTIEKEKLDGLEAAFLSNLVLGVIERKLTLDYNISLLLDRPLKKLKTEILCVLRMGAFQILFMDNVPVSAAVNESVKLIKSTNFGFAQGLVNAILRKISTVGLILPESGDLSFDLSIKYSCPEWLVKMWIMAYGTERAENILKYSVEVPPIYARVNINQTSSPDLVDILGKEGIQAHISEYSDKCIVFESKGNLVSSDSFKKGLFHFQNLSSQLLCEAIGATEGERVFDLCAAPGGKAFTLAQKVGEKGFVRAFDVKENRIKLIAEGIERLRLKNISADFGDATSFNESLGRADIVLCDVPCSGFGVLASKPEIKYKAVSDVDKLPKLQYFILCNAVRYLNISGLLVYSTCTLNPSENEEVCQRFLRENGKDFELLNTNFSDSKGFTTIFPDMYNSDGFFFAIFRKKG